MPLNFVIIRQSYKGLPPSSVHITVKIAFLDNDNIHKLTM